MAEEKHEHKMEHNKTEIKHENKVEEKKESEKKQEPKKIENKKRNYVELKAISLHISPKAGKHICDMIRYKKIDDAIKMVEEVVAMRRAVRMANREIGHRKGPGFAGGRYPVVCAGEFLKMLKQLKAQGIYHEMEIENSIVKQCYVTPSSKPYKRGGAKAKRAHVNMRLEINKKMEGKK